MQSKPLEINACDPPGGGPGDPHTAWLRVRNGDGDDFSRRLQQELRKYQRPRQAPPGAVAPAGGVASAVASAGGEDEGARPHIAGIPADLITVIAAWRTLSATRKRAVLSIVAGETPAAGLRRDPIA